MPPVHSLGYVMTTVKTAVCNKFAGSQPARREAPALDGNEASSQHESPSAGHNEMPTDTGERTLAEPL